MNRQINILTLLILIFSFSRLTFANGEIQVLDRAIKAIQPFTSEFTQEYYDAFQDKHVISNGKLSFMQPGLMKWSYEAPEEMLFIIGQENVWLYDPLLENVTVQELSRISGIRSLRFLAGDEDLSVLFEKTMPKKLLVGNASGHLVIALKPKEKNQALSELQLVFDLKNNRFMEFVLIDHNANYRKIVLSGINPDLSLKASDFQFLITDDMEVIQGISN